MRLEPVAAPRALRVAHRPCALRSCSLSCSLSRATQSHCTAAPATRSSRQVPHVRVSPVRPCAHVSG
eukprot:scaffold23728_cov129-Isochrysis_galbana.AAC.5